MPGAEDREAQCGLQPDARAGACRERDCLDGQGGQDSGDIEPEQIVERLRSGVQGVLVGRGVLRNPWILQQANDLIAGRAPRQVTPEERGRFLLDYIELLLSERTDESRALTHERWVVNKLRALGSWYTKGLENGSHLRTAINSAESLQQVRDDIATFFCSQEASPAA